MSLVHESAAGTWHLKDHILKVKVDQMKVEMYRTYLTWVGYSIVSGCNGRDQMG
jgi:hypothetical protein